jgi:signal transduction histidine kinase
VGIGELFGSSDEAIAFLEGVFVHSPLPLQIYSLAGHSLAVNDAFRTLFGSEPPPEYNVLADEIAAERGVSGDIARAFAGETVKLPPIWYDPRELKQVHVDAGRRVAIEATFFPLRDAAGVLKHIAVMFKDVTVDELVRERERRLHEMFDRAPFAIAIQRGPEHVYELANPAYRRYLGDRPLAGLKRREVLPDEASLAGILDRVYESGQPFVGREFPFRVDPTVDGAWREAWFDVLCEPTFGADRRPDGVITFAVDLTAQVEARRRLELLAHDLDRAVRVRDEFLTIASHELKTPLTALRLAVQALRRPVRVGSPEAVILERILRIEGLIDRVTERVNTLLEGTLSNQASELSLGSIDLARLVREVADRMSEAAEACGATIAVTDNALVPVIGRWDAFRLDQVVTNLLSNAIKYGAGKPIAVDVVRDAGRAVVRVRDQGIGIAAADHGRIFDRFERAVPARNFSGFGLGLWIVRQIVERLGGTIRVESELGAGATFVVELPLES